MVGVPVRLVTVPTGDQVFRSVEDSTVKAMPFQERMRNWPGQSTSVPPLTLA